MLCQESDEFIVVINFLPMKGGDMPEEKTERTLCKDPVIMVIKEPKAVDNAKERSLFKTVQQVLKSDNTDLNYLIGKVLHLVNSEMSLGV